MQSRHSFGLLLALAAAVALVGAGCPHGSDAGLPCSICGDAANPGTDSYVPPPPTDSGPQGTDAAPPAGPVITFLSPPASPAPGDPVGGPSLQVQFTIEDATAVVDTASVTCDVGTLSGVLNAPTGGGTTWQCTAGGFDSYASGPFDVTVTASNLLGGMSTAVLPLLHDVGPEIIFVAPACAPPPCVPIVTGILPLDFQIADPSLAVPASVSADLVGFAIPIAEGPAGEWTGMFDTTSSLTPIPDGPAVITVDAVSVLGNPPAPGNTLDVIIDNVGPVITFDTPLAGELVGGFVYLQVQVADLGSGVDSSLVTGWVGPTGTPFPLTPAGGDVYTATFDTNSLAPSVTSTSIFVQAFDYVGFSTTTSELIEIDNTRPTLELDPAPIALCDNADLLNGPQCLTQAGQRSYAFDPLGSAALSDLEIVGSDTLPGGPGPYPAIRAEIRDDSVGSFTNAEAGIDPATVFLYIIEDVSVPLVVDVDSDGVCDVINPNVIPGTGLGPVFAIPIPLDPVAPAGVAYYPDDASPPDPILASSSFDTLTVVVNDPPASMTAALFTIGPVVTNDFENLGQTYDTNNLSDGVKCLAVTADDNLGNSGVSKPIRVCVTNGAVGSCGTFGVATAPDCTGTMLGSVADPTTPCTAWNFGPPLLPPMSFPGVGAGREWPTGL
jgi:hypothetical protein